MDLAAAGFDIVHRFAARDAERERGLERLADPERPVALLVGNTRALWECFAAARANDPVLAASSDPIDLYTEHTIDAAAAALDGRVLYAHRQYARGYLPFQRLAVAAGLAALAPSQLLIHPIYGPWFAVRAVILCAGDPPPPATAVLASCACSEHGCATAFARAGQTDDWRAWVAVRDACPVGREHRYTDEQIAYHYTKDPRFLP